MRNAPTAASSAQSSAPRLLVSGSSPKVSAAAAQKKHRRETLRGSKRSPNSPAAKTNAAPARIRNPANELHAVKVA